VICASLRDLACAVKKNEIVENDVQSAGEAASRAPRRAMWESEKSVLEHGQRFSFHKKRLFVLAAPAGYLSMTILRDS
jgi:hypothetical protein